MRSKRYVFKLTCVLLLPFFNFLGLLHRNLTTALSILIKEEIVKMIVNGISALGTGAEFGLEASPENTLSKAV
jgi:hypothetical protein